MMAVNSPSTAQSTRPPLRKKYRVGLTAFEESGPDPFSRKPPGMCRYSVILVGSFSVEMLFTGKGFPLGLPDDFVLVLRRGVDSVQFQEPGL